METTEILSFINIALVIAIAQGLFITILLFHKHGALYANRFLGLLMLIFSLSLLHVYLSEQDFYNEAIIGAILPGVIFLLGPLHFLYTKYLIHQRQYFRKIELLHFLPALIFTLLIFFITQGKLFPAELQSTLLHEQESGFILINWIFIVHVQSYYIISIKKLIWYSRRIKDVFSSIEQVRLHWLRALTYLVIAINLIFLGENILNLFQMNITNFNLSSVLGAIYIYSMGYVGISKSNIFRDSEMSEIMENLPNDYSSEEEIKVKYERSGLSGKQAAEYMEALVKLMKENKLYLDSSLSLRQLAETMSISPHHLSEIINNHLHQNFFDFINGYRVDHVIQDLTSNNKNNLTLLGIGLDAGFNSKTTFNNIFKKHTGKTPSEYRRSLLKAS